MSPDPDVPVVESDDEPEEPMVSYSSKIMEAPQLSARFSTLYRQAPIKALQAKAIAEGYQPLTEDRDPFFGATNTFKTSSGATATFEMLLHSYSNPNTKGQAAIVSTKLKVGPKVETYQFLLVAPEGDPKNVHEFTLGPNNTVVLANSFWDRFVNCLEKHVGDIVWDVIENCTGYLILSWQLFFSCMAKKLGIWVLKCSACATCNCKWWCKRVVGCCK